MRQVLTTAPAAEPVGLSEAKLHCRVDIDDDDALITVLITAAREFVESYTQSALINQTWTVYHDYETSIFCKNFINLPLKPISSITSVTSYDADNVDAVFSSSNYFLSGNRVALNDDAEWPTDLRLMDCLAIRYVAGYGAAGSNVPVQLRQAIKMLIAHWYETREAVYDAMETTPSISSVPFGVTALLQPFRTISL